MRNPSACLVVEMDEKDLRIAGILSLGEKREEERRARPIASTERKREREDAWAAVVKEEMPSQDGN